MRHIHTTITGITPLLINRCSEETYGGGHASGSRRAPADEAEARLYTDEAGFPVIPQPNLLRCILDAERLIQPVRDLRTAAIKEDSLVANGLDIEGYEMRIQSDCGWAVDERTIRIPSTGKRVLRYWPIFRDWALSFEMTLDTDFLTVASLRKLVDIAGRRIGLGDFRPDRRGPFGKFRVTQWQVESAA
ncbi:hypothetical protein SCOR_15300 [Sulfidibacter corallicola]|uniref:Uncharacterized protein n=1 Tax=Sulfidibacter corallicola TaxID=2818388 RepID=A0A8A4U5Z4_SULCO|nr:hypothetical protein [Sulfidibacter corallicola]QTD54165.1 hypothetical protein J3U87_17100 [Sulfidibacter corallicola]